EPATARLAAATRNPDGVEALGRAAGRAVADDPAALHAADAEFHTAVAAASGNLHLIRFAEMLWMTHPHPAAYDAGVRALDGHAAIAAAIENGDVDEAERLSRAHLADSG